MQDEKRLRRAQLRTHIANTIKQAQPRLEEDVYQDFVQKLADQIINMFDKFLNSRKISRDQAEQKYEDAELKLIAKILMTVPESTGGSKISRDFLEAHMTRVFNLAGIKVSDTSRRILLNEFDKAFALYSGLSKVGYKQLGELIYESHENRILANINLGLIRERNSKALNKLQEHMNNVLEAAGLELEDYEKRNVQDQMLWLFSDYLQAGEADKDEVYALGEERILFSLFDPTKYSKGEDAEVTKFNL
jgi:hypothetical protein